MLFCSVIMKNLSYFRTKIHSLVSVLCFNRKVYSEGQFFPKASRLFCNHSKVVVEVSCTFKIFKVQSTSLCCRDVPTMCTQNLWAKASPFLPVPTVASDICLVVSLLI